MESAANPTRHKILEILIETPGLGAKALADRIGVTRQHVAYHIGELLKLGLIKDMQAGSIVIYHVTDLGRMVLQRIHSISISQAKDQVHVPPSQPPAPKKASNNRLLTFQRILVLAPLFAGLILLAYSFISAFIERKPSYVIGGIIVFIIFIVVQAIIVKKFPYYGR
ncbi:MAG: winged helix-turn-helix transcriptional regulator [Thermoproteota archaeon]